MAEINNKPGHSPELSGGRGVPYFIEIMAGIVINDIVKTDTVCQVCDNKGKPDGCSRCSHTSG